MFFFCQSEMSVAPLPPTAPAAPASAGAKAPFVFPTEDVQQLLDQCSASAFDEESGESIDKFNRLGACIVDIEDADQETFLAYGKSVTDSKDKNNKILASCGIFGPTQRYKKPACIDGSIALTPHALYSASKASGIVNELFSIEAQQVPALFFVPPTTAEGVPKWRFYPGSCSSSKVLEDGCVPVALVAWTPVTIRFVPHSQELRAKWAAMTVGGGYNGGKPNPTPFFRGELEKMLSAWEEENAMTWDLLPGQALITHTGMPFALLSSSEEEEYVVQAVGFEVLKPKNQSKKFWREALTTGTWTTTKDPHKAFCAYTQTGYRQRRVVGAAPGFRCSERSIAHPRYPATWSPKSRGRRSSAGSRCRRTASGWRRRSRGRDR